MTIDHSSAKGGRGCGHTTTRDPAGPVAILLGLVFVIVGGLKYALPVGELPHAHSLDHSELVEAVTALNPIIGGVEILMGIMLISCRLRSYGEASAIVLVAGATLYLLWMRFHGMDTGSCGCFGRLRVDLGWHLTINGTLLMGLTWLLARRTHPGVPAVGARESP